MAIPLDDWFGTIRREYVETFVKEGGGAVRIAVGDDVVMRELRTRLWAAADAGGFVHLDIDSARTRLHLLHTLVFVVAQAIDWDALTQARLEAVVAGAGYQWPSAGQRTDWAGLAAHNGVAAPMLRATIQRQITSEIWHDPGLAQDFRKAMMALVNARLGEDEEGLRAGVLDWLRGDLRALRAVRDAQIGARIGRSNARAILISICRWVRQCGMAGIVIALDIGQILRERREIMEGLAYSTAAVMDCYEVIRQMIDDAEDLEGLFLLVTAGPRLITDDVPKRALSQYTALKMRVWDDVRPQGLANPLSPLVELA